MSLRRSAIGLLGAAVLAVAACSSTGSSGSAAMPSIAIPSGAIPSIALEGFCADFSSKLGATWPDIDASTAATLGPVLSRWAGKAEMADVKADVTTIATWIASMATAGSVSSPPADVTTAFDRVKAFADTNC